MVATTAKEKEQLFRDLWNGKRPERIPIAQAVDIAVGIDKKGLNLVTDQFSAEKCVEAMDYITGLIDSDIFPITTPSCYAADKLLGSRKMVMSSGGFMQHQNICVMEDDEYPELAKDPFKYIVDKVLPRLYTNLTGVKEHDEFMFWKAQKISDAFFAVYMKGRGETMRKYERTRFDFNLGLGVAPFDDIADYLRSFSKIATDIRRQPEEVLAAVDAFTAYELKKMSLYPRGREGGRVFFALHMATFMREKDFAKFWWPSYIQILRYLKETDRGIYMFCEDDWSRFMPYLTECPDDSLMWFEKTDKKLIVDSLGKKKILTGMFPIENYTLASKEEAIDKTKEFIDLVGPTERYQFKANKSPLRGVDIDLDILDAIFKTVKEYGEYK